MLSWTASLRLASSSLSELEARGPQDGKTSVASATPSTAPVGAGPVAVRVLAIFGGGYAATSALVAAGVAVLQRMGLAPSDAFTVCSLLGFLVYLALILWAAIEPSLVRLLAWLLAMTAGGAALAWAAAPLVRA
jgi:hypothetical protein